jgi:hypothetical protein
MLRVAALAGALLIAIVGWLIFSRVHAAQLANDQLQARVTGATALAESSQQRSDEMEHLWDQSDDAHRTALQMGDQPGLRGNDTPDNRRRVEDILRREETTVDQMDQFASQAIADESTALSEFSDRYGSQTVSTARTDLATVQTEIHNESRHWDNALGAMLDSTKPALAANSYYVNDASSPVKDEFLAAEQSGENANAARDALQSDWDALNAKMKSESGEAAHDPANPR